MENSSNISLADDARFEAVQAEYFQLENIIEDFDQRQLTIKAWSVTLCTAGIGAAYIERQPALLAVSAIAAFMFWLLDLLWKFHQRAFYQRTWQIEEASQTDRLSQIRPFYIATSFIESFQNQRRNREMRSMAFWPHIALPHIGVALGSLALFVAHSIWWEL